MIKHIIYIIVYISFNNNILSQSIKSDTLCNRVYLLADSLKQAYPNLSGKGIQIRTTHQRTFMAARPSGIEVFRPAHRRGYTLWVHSCTRHPGCAILWLMGDSARTGLVAHELAHLAHYDSVSSLGLLAEGVRYKISMSFRRKYENQTDNIAIRHGFGPWLAAYARFIETSPHVTPGYRAYKRKYYYRAEELEGE